MRFHLLHFPCAAFVLFCQGAAFSLAADNNADAALIRVALFDDVGCSGPGVARVTQQIGAARGNRTTKIKGAEIADGRLKEFDVVIFTGGSASQQSKTLGDKGREEIRKFVRDGGGYIGICAGAYLACSGFDWGLGILNARTVTSAWQRGVGDVEIEPTEQGSKIAQIVVNRRRNVFYENGPIITRDGRSDIPEYDVLAWYRTELSQNNTPAGVMINSPAMACSSFGKGHVMISSPHPEQTEGMEHFMENAVRWAAEGSRK
jgi:glutamine amidotransferase-like uncharacterized protein